jgi:hypothetical protein
MKKYVFIYFLLFAAGIQAQTGFVKTYAFSRKIIPGAPPNEPNPVFPTEYYIYVILPPGKAPDVRGVWVNKQFFKATLEKTASPVLAPDHPGMNLEKRDTLVPATRQVVYRVLTGTAFQLGMATKSERAMRSENELVVYLHTGKKWLYGRVKTVKQLPPLNLP